MYVPLTPPPNREKGAPGSGFDYCREVREENQSKNEVVYLSYRTRPHRDLALLGQHLEELVCWSYEGRLDCDILRV